LERRLIYFREPLGTPLSRAANAYLSSTYATTTHPKNKSFTSIPHLPEAVLE
jgi:hypothetical protein